MEQRKQIKDFPKYEVSDLGNIYKTNTEKKIKPFLINKDLYVNLYGEQRKHLPIKNLVANAFIEGYNANHKVSHIDGDIYNNKASNLVLKKKSHVVSKRMETLIKNRNTVLELYKSGKLIDTYDQVTDLAKVIGIKQSNVYRLIDLKPKCENDFYIKRVKKVK